MDWKLVLIVAAVVVGMFVIKRLGFIGAAAAREHLKSGALVVDVRSPEEFNSGKLPGAVNVPLGELGELAPRRLPDKNRVLLLHCLSGTRSGFAKSQLKSMGYTKVFNLGSLGRARSIFQKVS